MKEEKELPDIVRTESGTIDNCPNCGNKYELPERDDSIPGFADIYDFFCEKCDEHLGSVRIDVGLPDGGYGWKQKWRAPTFLEENKDK